ncbi:hypothetical protein [Agromyces sp. SYSU T00266]|uniref:hypothetical protein n=1 Tax=Agromyces zhanjiangensis TaxID=3158562 RepID=UPI0033962360
MISRTMTNIGAGIGLAAALTLGSGAAAYAHECYNANRSEKGNAGASNSQAWLTVYFEELTFGLEEADAECVTDAYASTGAPMSFTIHVKGANGNDGVVAGNNPHEAKAADGKGIDEIFAAHGADLFYAFDSCGLDLPF